jgi:hypothetical protein
MCWYVSLERHIGFDGSRDVWLSPTLGGRSEDIHGMVYRYGTTHTQEFPPTSTQHQHGVKLHFRIFLRTCRKTKSASPLHRITHQSSKVLSARIHPESERSATTSYFSRLGRGKLNLTSLLTFTLLTSGRFTPPPTKNLSSLPSWVCIRQRRRYRLLSSQSDVSAGQRVRIAARIASRSSGSCIGADFALSGL